MRYLVAAALLACAGACDDGSTSGEVETDAGRGGNDMRVAPPLMPTIEITSPMDGVTLSATPVEVTGNVTGTAAGVLPTVTVNGMGATVEGNGQFSVQLPLESGPNTITATVDGVSDSIMVTVDTAPPRIDITNPERGGYSEAGQIDLEFTITDDSALDVVTLDGRGVDSGLGPNFVVPGLPLAPGVNILQLEASDAGGNSAREHVSVLHGQLGDPSQTIPGALRARLGTRAIDGLEVFAAEQLEMLDLVALLPVDQFEAPPFAIRVVRIDYARPIDVQLTPTSGALDLNMTLRDVLLEVEVQIGEREPRRAGLGVASLVVEGVIVPAVVDGSIEVELNEPAINLNGLEIEFGDIPEFENDPEEGQSVLEETISRALEFVVVDQIPPLIQGFLSDLDTSFEVELLGAMLNIAFIPELIVVSATGIAARVDGRVDLMNPAPGMPTLAGPLVTPTNWDGVPVTEDIALAVDDDFLNLLFYQLWRSGQLFPTLDQAFFEESGSSLRIVTGVLGNLLAKAYPDVNRTTPMKIGTSLPLPPVARVLKGDGEAVGLEIGVGDLSIDVRTDDAMDRHLLAGHASIRLQAAVGLTNGEDGLELLLDINDTVAAFDVSTEELRGEAENEIEGPLNDLLGGIGGILPGLLGDIPLPAVDFLPIGDVTARSGAEDPNFLVVIIGVQ